MGKNDFIIVDNVVEGFKAKPVVEFPKKAQGILYTKIEDASIIKRVIIPENVEFLGEDCFSGMMNLEEVEFARKSNLRIIHKKAFCNTKSLKRIKLPDSVNRIEDKAFCLSGIEEINIPEGTVHIDDGAFDGCNKLKVLELSKASLKNLILRGFQGLFENTNLTELKMERYYDGITFYEEYKDDAIRMSLINALFRKTPLGHVLHQYTLNNYKEELKHLY